MAHARIAVALGHAAAWLSLAGACTHPHGREPANTLVPPRASPHRTAGTPAPEPPGADEACPPEAGLPAEPEPPQIECVIEPVTRCVPPSPVRSAWQPEPFTQCPRELAPFVDDALRQPARFSARATRSRRLGETCAATPPAGECCYVQFTAHVCR